MLQCAPQALLSAPVRRTMFVVSSRWISVAVALVSATLFAISVWSGGWWTVGEDVAIGPLGTRQCFGGTCRTTSLSWIGGNTLWHRGAAATWSAGLVTMAVLIGLAATIASGRQSSFVAKTALVSVATAAAAAAYFVAGFPGVPGASVSLGAALYGGAVIFGAVATIRVVRQDM